MQVHHATGEVKSSGFRPAVNFKIAMTAHAFKILSSQVYSNPVLATIRETVCNAYDAHVKISNQHTPVEVQLPSRLDPMFIVKDFGPGLSPEAMNTIVTTYFLSDKNDSNELIGGLGIGFKAPFSVTNSFIIESRHGGMRYTFAAIMGPDGLPALSEQSDPVPCIEHTGLTLYIPIPENKIQQFRDTAPNILARFCPLPIVTGAVVSPVKYTLKGDSWAIRKTVGNFSAIAVMGHVPYEIKTYSIPGLTGDEQGVLNLPIDLTFNIGELEVQASREGLHYTDAVKSHIKQRAAEILPQLIATFEKEVAPCTSIIQAKLKYEELIADHYSVRAFLHDKLKWNGELINNSLYEFKGTFRVINYNRRAGRKVCKIGINPTLDLSETRYVIADARFHLATRVNLWAEENEITDTQFLICTEEYIPTLEVHGLSYTRLSEMPEPPKVERAPRRSKSVKKILKYDFAQREFLATNHNASVGGTYVDLYNGYLTLPNEHIVSTHSLKDFSELTGITDIYAFPASFKEIPLKNNTWELLWPKAEAAAMSILKSREYAQYVVNRSDAAASIDYNRDRLLKVLEGHSIKNTRALKALEAYRFMKNIKSNAMFDAAAKVGNCLNLDIKMKKVKPSFDLEKLWGQLLVSRPLLKLMSLSNYTSDEYVNLLLKYIG